MFAIVAPGGFGKRILIKHNDNLEINYYHLSNVTVKEGNIVHKGQEIGVSGSTGLTTINGWDLQQKSMLNL